MDFSFPANENRRPHKFTLPGIPESDWCDYRKEYEAGLSLRKIAELHYVDPRTVRSALENNTDSRDLGKRHAPVKLSRYEERILKMIPEIQPSSGSLTSLSRQLTLHLRECGYTGSERTVRNYLHTLPSVTCSYTLKDRKGE